ncbi:TPR repeat-containing protein [Corynebacterium suranareeae]|uniref:TPR repeat-containing protein n=1 Tax=Corynebacterium suranareeae TaxID=2506452 RepID=A0A160PQE1_9CORY|nr:hypothetical protein [Corynebacterium suranareeae]BAU95764.1 TPR repeat-containing protein [Corynebacterium suranareeae]
MADNFDRQRDNDRSGDRGRYRNSRGNDDRGNYRQNRDGESRDRGGYRGDRRDNQSGEYRHRDDRRGNRGGDDRRGGYRSDRNFEDRGRRNDRSDDRRDDRRGGDRPYGRTDRDGQSRGGYRGIDRRDDRRGGQGNRQGGGDRRHANRGGRDQQRDTLHPQRSGFREERINSRLNEPDLPGDIDIKDLDPLVLQDLKVLSKDNAEAVAKHMIMAATWLADDPQLALRHARAAKDRAGRVSVVRETNGIAAYHAGEWKEALSELRAARRMSGGPGLIAVMADCERGLGRPEKAIELARNEDLSGLDQDSLIELAIVVAGARHDLGQHDSAIVELQKVNPSLKGSGLTQSRLSYAYADALVLAGRADESREWFQHAADLDEDGFLDAKERIEELDKGNN